MRGFQKIKDFPGTIKVELSPGNYIFAIPEIIFQVENIGLYLQVKVLNAAGMAPLEFYDNVSWLVPHSWIQDYLRGPGMREISERELNTLERRASGQ